MAIFIFIISFISGFFILYFIGKGQEEYEKIQAEKEKKKNKEGDED